MRKPQGAWLAWGLALALPGCATTESLRAVNVPVSDLRAQPHSIARAGVHDPLEETQLLYGEAVRVLKIEDGWAQVEAIEQAEFTHARRWQGYPGWLPAAALAPWSAVWAPTIVVTEPWATTLADPFTPRLAPWRFPMGTRLRAAEMGETLWKVELLDGSTVWMPHGSARTLAELARLPRLERRRMVLANAQRLIGQPYYWGGLSPRNPEMPDRAAGMDCSGLIHLAYRAAGMDLPRDAHEQFLRAARIHALQPADLLFLSERGNPSRIVHVMLYAGAGELLEGPGTGKSIRRISVAERLGQPLDWIAPGTIVDGQTVFFGTYLDK